MTPVERVARAILETREARYPEHLHKAWEQSTDLVHTLALDDARAAIAALREPTEGMVNAGFDAGQLHMEDEEPGCYQAVWHAMIGAALKES